MNQHELYQAVGSIQSDLAHVKSALDKFIMATSDLDSRLETLERKDVRLGGFIAGVSFVAGMTGVIITTVLTYGKDILSEVFSRTS